MLCSNDLCSKYIAHPKEWFWIGMDLRLTPRPFVRTTQLPAVTWRLSQCQTDSSFKGSLDLGRVFMVRIFPRIDSDVDLGKPTWQSADNSPNSLSGSKATPTFRTAMSAGMIKCLQVRLFSGIDCV
jgi:hypothetical protein